MGLQWISDAISLADNKKCDNWCEARKEFIKQLLSQLEVTQDMTQMNESSILRKEYYVNSKYYCTHNILKQ